jgi:Peptidase S46.
MVAGLQDPAVLERKRSEEKALRAQVEKEPGLKRQYGDAWDRVEESVKEMRPLYLENQLLEGAGRGLGSPWAFNSTLFNVARTLVRHAEEKDKPNAERLREYQDANLESLKQLLFSPAPIYEDLETVKLGDSLGMFAELRGADEPLVKQVLDGKAPPPGRRS